MRIIDLVRHEAFADSDAESEVSMMAALFVMHPEGFGYHWININLENRSMYYHLANIVPMLGHETDAHSGCIVYTSPLSL